MIKRYAKKPKTVEVLQFTGTLESRAELSEFLGEYGTVPVADPPKVFTPNGPLIVCRNDWVVKGAGDDFYPVRDEIFASLFDAVPEIVTMTYQEFMDGRGPAQTETATKYEHHELAYRQGSFQTSTTPIADSVRSEAHQYLRADLEIALEPVPVEDKQAVFDAYAKDAAAYMDNNGAYAEFDPPDDMSDNPFGDSGIIIGVDTAQSESYSVFTFGENHPHRELVVGLMALTGSGQIVVNGTFETALVAMKAGYRVTRHGWNGKGMWICLGDGQKIADPAKFWNRHTRRWAEERSIPELESTNIRVAHEVLPYFIMKTADDKILMGWLASQTDLLAQDWIVLED